MKILVDEMPTQVEDCPWSYPTENPWNDRTIWFCSWGLSHSETCPMAKGANALILSKTILIVLSMPSMLFLRFFITGNEVYIEMNR